jgi:putative membrane protein (TIGR04086 family)
MALKMSPISKREAAMEYVSAACLANVPSWTLLLILTFINIRDPFLSTLGFLTIFGGAMLGGFFVTKNRTQDIIKTGASIGLLSYIIHVFSIMLLFGNSSPLLTGDGGDILLMVDFAFGGIFGGMINKRRFSKKTVAPI